MNEILILAVCGMASPIVYTLMWIIGGWLRSDYNHIRDDISSLFAVGAPNQQLMRGMIIVQSVLLLLFFLSLPSGLKDGGSVIGPYLLIIASIIGITIPLFFPLDENGELGENEIGRCRGPILAVRFQSRG